MKRFSQSFGNIRKWLTDGAKQPPRPTNALPGSPGKIEVMRCRYEAGYLLHHPQDATGAESKPMKVWAKKNNYRRYWRVVQRSFKFQSLVAIKKYGVSKYRLIGSFDSREEAEAAARDYYDRHGIEVIE